MNWGRIFVISSLIIFWILVLLSMCSCGQKHWTKRGYKNRWIDSASVKDTIFIPADTVLIDSTAESFIYTLDTLLQDTCINKANRAKIKYIIKKEFIPAAQRAFKDTAVTGKDGNKYHIRFTPAGIEITADIKKQIIKLPPADRWHSDWPYWLIIFLLSLLIFWGSRRK